MIRIAKTFASQIAEDSKVLWKAKFGNRTKVEPEIIGNVLDYLCYERMHGKICENNNSLGFVLRVSHFSGIDKSKMESLKQIIENLPDGLMVQIMNYACPKVGDLVDRWEQTCERDGVFKGIARRRAEFLKKGVWNPLVKGQDYRSRNFELYMTFAYLKPKGRANQKDMRAQLEKLEQKLVSSFKQLGLWAESLGREDMGALLREFIVPKTMLYRESTEVRGNLLKPYLESKEHTYYMHPDSLEIIREQSDIDGNVIIKENFNYLVFEVTKFPEEWRLENSIDYMGDFEGKNFIPYPFMVMQGFKLESWRKSEESANARRMLKAKQGESKLPKFFPKMIEEIEDWYYATEKIDQGERLGDMVLMIWVNVLGDNVVDAEQRIIDHFARLKMKAENVKYDVANSFLSMLPFGMVQNWESLKRYKVTNRMLSGTCMHMMPVFADGQNYVSPAMIFLGRQGQLFYFDNFKSSQSTGNYNMIVIGKPGKGKSVFLQEYMSTIVKGGGEVVLLDDGRSSENTCKLIEGDFVDFKSGWFCINPFSMYKPYDGIISEAEYKTDFEAPFVELVLSILCIIMGIDNNAEKSVEVSMRITALKGAIYEVMKKFGDCGGFTQIWEELKENKNIRKPEAKDICDQMAYILEPYAIGQYKKYFNGSATLRLNNAVTIFELKELENDLVLRDSVLLTAVFLVYTKMQKRDCNRSLIIDEAWKLLVHPAMKKFIDTISRTARKYRGSLVIATQNVTDFDSSFSEAAAAVLSQAEWVVMFSASGNDKRLPMLKNNFGMSDGEIDIVERLDGKKGVYSEFMLRHNGGNAGSGWQIGRLFLDDFSVKLFSSKAEDVELMNKYKAEGMTIEQAVEKTMESGRV